MPHGAGSKPAPTINTIRTVDMEYWSNKVFSQQ